MNLKKMKLIKTLIYEENFLKIFYVKSVNKCKKSKKCKKMNVKKSNM